MAGRAPCRGLVCLALWLWLCGCAAGGPTNPSFSVSVDEAREVLSAMRERPVPLRRPVVVLGGWMDPGFAAPRLAEAIREHTAAGSGEGPGVLAVSFFGCADFDACREHLLREVEAAFPSDDPHWTQPVDVVALSMGGLVARYAAMMPAEAPDGQAGAAPVRRLRVVRLFTIGTPHRGADWAPLAPWDALARNMRADSVFLGRLNDPAVVADDPIYAYVRLGDQMVGSANASPPGGPPWWVPNLPFQQPHNGAFSDPRILADILRRLRSEPPLARTPPAPLPETEG